MKRRNFISATVGAAAAGALGAFAQPAGAAQSGAKFKMKYAPRVNMFQGHVGPDPLENLKFMAGQGFTAFFDLGLANLPNSDQIMEQARKLGLEAGPISAGGRFKWGTDDDAVRKEAVDAIKKGLENGKRLGITGLLVVPGSLIDGMTVEQMTANVVKNLKFVCDNVDFGGNYVVLEPLNHRNHPGMFLTKISQAMDICKAVGNPGIKIINDLYHQQITEGDLIPNIDAAWDYIGGFHLGDTPGRNEPLTGEINYRNIFKHLNEKGCTFPLCMEHGLSLASGGGKKKGGKGKGAKDDGASKATRIEAEKRLIAAYRWCDQFDQPIV